MGELIELRTVPGAVSLLDQWQEKAERMESLYELACIRADMSAALVESYAAEVERLRGLLE